MALFKKSSKKVVVDPNVDVEGRSKAFYDQYIFGEDKQSANLLYAYVQTLIETIGEADPAFLKVGVVELWHEIIILRLELVSLYWLHTYGEESAIDQSIFTYHYLHDKDKDKLEQYQDSLWNDMDDYTQAVAASVVNQEGKSKKPQIYKMRADIFDKYFALYGSDDEDDKTGEAIAKVANRSMSEAAWKKDLTRYYLAITLWKKLDRHDHKLNKAAYQKLMFAIRGLYEGIRDEM